MPRLRECFPELVRDLGFYPPGGMNSITDVPGVEVGQFTIHDSASQLHTGLTAIWPRRDVFTFRPRASGHVLHGTGEVSGFQQLMEWGLIETPILLTSTMNVGKVYDGVVDYLQTQYPDIGVNDDVVIPLVAECDDSHLSVARDRPMGIRDVRQVLSEAKSGPVSEGQVGAGSGMMAFDFAGGIGTSSRVIDPRTGEKPFVLGALVNANVGITRQLRLAGYPIGKHLLDHRVPRSGPDRSIIVVLATDAPMRPDQLKRLAMRAGMGLARVGSFAGNGSGELIVAFTTSVGEARVVPEKTPLLRQTPQLREAGMDAFFEATVECVEEAVLNSLTANTQTLIGRAGHQAMPLPVSVIRDLVLNKTRVQ